MSRQQNFMGHLIDEKRFLEIINKLTSIEPIAVVGDLGIDKYTYGEVTRISPEAPVPVLSVTKEWEKLGLAANIAHNLKTLGIEATLCGTVGDDQKAVLFEDLLEECGLKTWGLVRDQSRPTIFKERITTPTQQICRIDYEETSSVDKSVGNKITDRVRDFLKDHEGVILEDYCKGTLTEEVIGNVIGLAKEAGKVVAVDPGRMTPPHYYKGATLLKPNFKEAQMMVESMGYTYEKKNLEDMAAILIDKLEIEKLVITLGSEGMALFDTKDEKGLHIIPTVAQEVFDVSGAGDTTISLLVAGLLAGGSLEEAAWLGNCGAGVVVAKRGTATVDREELTVFYHRLCEQYH